MHWSHFHLCFNSVVDSNLISEAQPRLTPEGSTWSDVMSSPVAGRLCFPCRMNAADAKGTGSHTDTAERGLRSTSEVWQIAFPLTSSRKPERWLMPSTILLNGWCCDYLIAGNSLCEQEQGVSLNFELTLVGGKGTMGKGGKECKEFVIRATGLCSIILARKVLVNFRDGPADGWC